MKDGRVVILGAGFAGLLTALTLARRNYAGEIVLVDERAHHTYSPWLYEVATSFFGLESRAKVRKMKHSAIYSIQDILSKNPGVRFRQARVAAAEFHDQYLVFEDGHTLRYDYLVIALGSQSEFYNIPGLAEHALPLKSIDDALLIRTRLDQLLRQLEEQKIERARVVVCGAGATGVELAAELANSIGVHGCRIVRDQHCLEVDLLEAGPEILSPFPPALRKKARANLGRVGVNVKTDTVITEVRADRLIAKTGEIHFDACIWSGGVRPNEVLSTWGLSKDARGRLQIGDDFRVREFKNVFALGDCASFIDSRTQRTAPPTAWVAMRQGQWLGKNLPQIINGEKTNAWRLPKNYPAVIMVGGRFVVASILGAHWSGRLLYFLRRLVDLHYFLVIFPFWAGLKFWWRGTKVFELND